MENLKNNLFKFAFSVICLLGCGMLAFGIFVFICGAIALRVDLILLGLLSILLGAIISAMSLDNLEDFL